jgi:hypothetical protein
VGSPISLTLRQASAKWREQDRVKRGKRVQEQPYAIKVEIIGECGSNLMLRCSVLDSDWLAFRCTVQNGAGKRRQVVTKRSRADGEK